jgi:hypothetical protein
MEKGVGLCSLTHSTLGVEGRAGTPSGTRMSDKQVNYSHGPSHNPNNKLVSAWLNHFWCINKPRAYTNS